MLLCYEKAAPKALKPAPLETGADLRAKFTAPVSGTLCYGRQKLESNYGTIFKTFPSYL